MYESMPVIIILCMKVCLRYIIYIIYLYVCTNEDVYTLYIYMQSCCWLQEVQVGVMHYIIHFVICLHCMQLTCEKDVGMGLCTLTLCLGYHYTLFACFLALHPYIFLNFFEFFFIDLFV